MPSFFALRDQSDFWCPTPDVSTTPQGRDRLERAIAKCRSSLPITIKSEVRAETSSVPKPTRHRSRSWSRHVVLRFADFPRVAFDRFGLQREHGVAIVVKLAMRAPIPVHGQCGRANRSPGPFAFRRSRSASRSRRWSSSRFFNSRRRMWIPSDIIQQRIAERTGGRPIDKRPCVELGTDIGPPHVEEGMPEILGPWESTNSFGQAAASVGQTRATAMRLSCGSSSIRWASTHHSRSRVHHFEPIYCGVISSARIADAETSSLRPSVNGPMVSTP